MEGGAAIYSLREKASKKFRMHFVFSNGLYSFPVNKVPVFSAFVDNVIEGGAGARSFEDISNFVAENAISLESSANSQGRATLTVSGLLAEFPKALALVEDIILRPRFNSAAFDVWRQAGIDDFESLLDAGDGKKQSRFMSLELNKMAFGADHFLTRTLNRQSPAALKKISVSEFPEIAKRVMVRSGLYIVVSGGVGEVQIANVKRMMMKVSIGELMPELWLPERPVSSSVSSSAEQKISVAVIQKADMKQSSAELRVIIPDAGKLNVLESTEVALAGEVFSASGGVVGNDRWSKAMRADSGLSYSAHASFMPSLLEPNTNTGMWRMIFQTPNDRADEACLLAQKTWQDFSRNGVSAQELEVARVTNMNSLLAREETVFGKAAMLEGSLARGELINSAVVETALARQQALEGKIERVNATISRLASKGAKPFLVIMGNISKEKIDKIASMPGFELKSTALFSDLAKSVVVE